MLQFHYEVPAEPRQSHDTSDHLPAYQEGSFLCLEGAVLTHLPVFSSSFALQTALQDPPTTSLTRGKSAHIKSTLCTLLLSFLTPLRVRNSTMSWSLQPRQPRTTMATPSCLGPSNASPCDPHYPLLTPKSQALNATNTHTRVEVPSCLAASTGTRKQRPWRNLFLPQEGQTSSSHLPGASPCQQGMCCRERADSTALTGTYKEQEVPETSGPQLHTSRYGMTLGESCPQSMP